MDLILWILGLLVGPPLAVFFVVYPRMIDDAPWYGTFTESLYLYCFPPFFFVVGVASGLEVFERLGVPWPYWLEQLLVGPGVLALFVGVLGTLGIPMPPFLTPKWIRERRKQDRQERRRRRSERREERRRRRARERGLFIIPRGDETIMTRPRPPAGAVDERSSMDPQFTRIEHEQLAATLEVPAQWEIDYSGIGHGLVIAGDSAPWSLNFVPTIVFTQAVLGTEDASDPRAVLEAQQVVEGSLDEQLADYRPLHLDVETFGVDPDGRPVQGVMRSAYYTSAESVPLMMHQWVGRHSGVELSMTCTFPVPDLEDWAEGSWTFANTLIWKGHD